MKTLDPNIADHYAVPALGDRILDALHASGRDVNHLRPRDLAAVDGFHIRGREATEELARLAEIQERESVLDVGSGLGGTARYLAESLGCRVQGVDLTEDYCRVAEMLTFRVGLADRVGFRHADALELPFDGDSFDVVWTEHVQMNIAEKRCFYAELARVLRPGGRLAFYDVFAGSHVPPRYPVPWADEASISHLLPAQELPRVVGELGFDRIHCGDATPQAIAFLRRTLAHIRAQGWPEVGLHLLMGEEAETKLANLLHNLERGRLIVVMAVLRLLDESDRPISSRASDRSGRAGRS